MEWWKIKGCSLVWDREKEHPYVLAEGQWLNLDREGAAGPGAVGQTGRERSFWQDYPSLLPQEVSSRAKWAPAWQSLPWHALYRQILEHLRARATQAGLCSRGDPRTPASRRARNQALYRCGAELPSASILARTAPLGRADACSLQQHALLLSLQISADNYTHARRAPATREGTAVG